MRQQTSLLTEIGWLVYFLAIFAIGVYLLNFLVVPHHFNETIAIIMAAIFAALAMITTRAAYTNRRSR